MMLNGMPDSRESSSPSKLRHPKQYISYQHYQLKNRVTYMADETFKHCILLRSYVFVSLESR